MEKMSQLFLQSQGKIIMLNCVKKEIAFRLNRINYKKKNTIINSKFVSKDCKIGEWCQIGEQVIIGENVKIGRYTYFNCSKYWSTIESNVTIGSFCSIAPNVHIAAGNHNYDYVTTHPILFNDYYKEISSRAELKERQLKDAEEETIIGNDVWAGFGSIIKRGVKVGNGAVIAAGAVVVKDVPDYAIVGGNPAHIIKYRTSKSNIELFNKNDNKMWWNWTIEKITENIEMLYNLETYAKHFLEI
jgi:acetyltransferase-like isoleucine patch superfamily enzyme